ncbi:hypothetical protein [Natronomonas amylolytica]|uniref:hypothetical protein n=1 Tax=Natronomonas amylolytica TaxID=3108498 RepID=UPI00300BAD47
MPVLHRYIDKSGYYISAAIPGEKPFTYQVNDQAATLFEDLGYEDESKLPWELLRPLRVIGHLYTKNEEYDPEISESDIDLTGISTPSLTTRQRNILSDYLHNLNLSPSQKQKLSRFLNDPDTDGTTTFDIDPDPTITVDSLDLPDDVRETVEDWLDTHERMPFFGVTVEDIHDVPKAKESLTDFVRHPAHILRFSASTHLWYTINIDGGGSCSISDCRFESSTDYDFRLSFRSNREVEWLEETSHSVKITDGYIHDWTLDVDDNDVRAMENKEPYEPTIEDHHAHLHEKIEFIPFIHSFFDDFNDYKINTPHTEQFPTPR